MKALELLLSKALEGRSEVQKKCIKKAYEEVKEILEDHKELKDMVYNMCDILSDVECVKRSVKDE